MEHPVQMSENGVDPVEYVRSYFTHLKDREISVLVGSIGLLGTVEYKLLTNVLNLEQIEIEEKIGRLMQTDLLDGKFLDEAFQLTKFNYPILKQTPNMTLDDRILLGYIKARFEVTAEEIQLAFGLSYESTIYVLSTFVAKGLVTPQKMENGIFQFIVHYQKGKQNPDQISELEKQIVGYGIIRERITIKEIAIDLGEPEHKVLSTLINLILSDTITLVFEKESKFLSGLEIYVILDKFQVEFPKRAISLLSNEERQIIGYISLRREVTIQEMMVSLNYSRVTILRIISLLVATGEFSCTMTDQETIILVQELAFKPTRSIDTLTTIHNFNYRMMLGIIKTQPIISIRNISKKMQVREIDILFGLINCYLEGLIVGNLDQRSMFNLKNVRNLTSTSELTLEEWERIIIGALISEKVLSWPKIAALLDVDRKSARNRAFEFMSRGFIKTQAKDSVLILNEIPQLPLLTQINNLKGEEQEMYGYLLRSENPDFKRFKSLFKLTNMQAYRKLYFLSGSGLCILQRKGQTLLVSRKQKFEPTLSVNELDIKYQNLIRYLQTTQTERVDFGRAAQFLKTSRYQVIRDLCYLLANGYYKGKIFNTYFIRESGLLTTHLSSNCIYCSQEIKKIDKPCPNCDKTQPLCGVCKGHLSSGEQLVSCPHCYNLSHSLHLRQWLNIKGECPFCRNKLNERDLLIRQPLL